MLWIIRIVGILCILLTAGVLSVGKGAFHEITAAILFLGFITCLGFGAVLQALRENAKGSLDG